MKPYSLEELRKVQTFKVQFRHSDVGPWWECEVPTQFIANGLVDHIREQKRLNKFWSVDDPPKGARIVKCKRPFDIAEFVHPYSVKGKA